VTILDLEGGITFGGGAVDLRRHTCRLIAEGRANILLNLAGVRYLDSSGLGEMVAAQTAARRGGSRVAILSPSANVRELFEVMAPTGVFDIYENESAAVERMEAGRD
jgi:anti-sigma B factor antagonist